MKNILIITAAIFVTGVANASFQTPLQQSANTVKAVLSSILADQGLTLRSITKIQVSTDGAKAQLVDQKGECLAIPYVITYDAMGLPSATPDKAALAICN